MDRALIALVAACALGSALAAPPPLPYEARGRSLGVASCANSLCHGSVEPWENSRVLQNEYVIWSRDDRHARAYATLLSERSASIVRKLGLREPAHEAAVCLDCHANNVPRARRSPGFTLSDGIGCEACHGPAERWIRSHVDPSVKRPANLARGLYPVWEPVARTRLCQSCHFGNAQKLVTHRMMAAGHPRLSFEIDTFVHIQPAHYGRGAPGAEGLAYGVRNWAIGQALAAEELLGLLVHPTRGRDGLFPELVLFDCHACHHRMSDQRNAGARLGIAPGAVRLNDSNLIMLRQIVRRIDARAGESLALGIERLYAAIGGGDDALAQARRVRQAIQELVPKISAHRFSGEDLRGIVLGLIDDGLRGQYSDYQGAEQAAMALQAVADFMARRGMLTAAAVKPAMGGLMAAVANDEDYKVERFAHALRELRVAIGGGTGQ